MRRTRLPVPACSVHRKYRNYLNQILSTKIHRRKVLVQIKHHALRTMQLLIFRQLPYQYQRIMHNIRHFAMLTSKLLQDVDLGPPAPSPKHRICHDRESMDTPAARLSRGYFQLIPLMKHSAPCPRSMMQLGRSGRMRRDRLYRGMDQSMVT